MSVTAAAVAALIARPVGGSTSASSATTVYLAGPLDQVNTWVSQWGTSLQILGGTILAICMVLVGIKLGAKSVARQRGQHRAPGGGRGDLRPGDRGHPDRRRPHRGPVADRCRVQQWHDRPARNRRPGGGVAGVATDDQVIYSDDYTRLFTYQSRQFTAGICP